MYLLITNGGFSIAFEGVEVFFRSACFRPLVSDGWLAPTQKPTPENGHTFFQAEWLICQCLVTATPPKKATG